MADEGTNFRELYNAKCEELQSYQNEVDDWKSKVTAKVTLLTTEKNVAEEALEQLRLRLQRSEADRNEAQVEIAKNKITIESLQKNILESDKALEQAKTDAQTAQNEITRLQKQVHQQQEENDVIRRQSQSLREASNPTVETDKNLSLQKELSELQQLITLSCRQLNISTTENSVAQIHALVAAANKPQNTHQTAQGATQNSSLLDNIREDDGTSVSVSIMDDDAARARTMPLTGSENYYELQKRVERLNEQLEEKEALILRIKERAKEILRQNRAKLKVVSLAVLALKDEVNDFGVDFEEMQDAVRDALQWKTILGDNSLAMQQLQDKVSEIEGKEQEFLWLRGRTETLTAERDSLALQNESLRLESAELVQSKYRVAQLAQENTHLTNTNAQLSTQIQSLIAQKEESQNQHNESAKQWEQNKSELQTQIAQLQETIAQMKAREERCVSTEVENEMVKAQFVEMNANLRKLEYERSVLELRTEELMRRVESERNRANALQEAAADTAKKHMLALDKLAKQVASLEIRVEEERMRGQMAEERVKVEMGLVPRQKATEGEDFDEFDAEGAVGQQKQLEVFMDNYIEFTRTLELYIGVLHDELSLRTAVSGTDLEHDLGNTRRSHVSSDTPSPQLIQQALQVVQSINGTIKNLKMLRKLLRKLCVEHARWNWWAQMRENLKDVGASVHTCVLHTSLAVVAVVCFNQSDENGKRLSLAERIQQLKRRRKEQAKGTYSTIGGTSRQHQSAAATSSLAGVDSGGEDGAGSGVGSGSGGPQRRGSRAGSDLSSASRVGVLMASDDDEPADSD